MPAFAIPLAISGISALAGLLGNRKKQATQDSTTTQNTSGTENYDNYNTPILTPEAMQAYSTLFPQLQNRIQSGADLSGYTASGLRNITNTGENARNRIVQNLAARGLTNSPASAAIIARQGDTQAGETANFLNSVPLLQRQMQGQDLDQLLRAASALPTGMRQQGSSTRTGTSTSNTRGTVTQPSDMLGGLFSGLGQGLASTYGYNWALEQRKKLGLPPTTQPTSTGSSGYDPVYNSTGQRY
jgi:hypothetical protein